MGKNQGFLSVNFSKARDNSTWAVSWLAELTVTPSPLPPFTPPLPCVRLKNLRVKIQNVPVCTGTTPACGNTCARGAGTHGDVLNLHTEVFLRAKPRHTPRHTHNTQHNTHHTTQHTPQHTTPHGDRETQRQRQTETERDRERQRKRQRKRGKTRQERRRRDNKREETTGSAAPLVISTRGLYWLTNYVNSMCCLDTCCDITI